MVVLAVGIGTWAEAVPVKTVDNKTGNITIVDKATGQKIFMTDRKLSYVKGWRKWSRIPVKGYDYIDAALTDYGVVIASSKEKYTVIARLYSTANKLQWEINLGDIGYNFGLSENNRGKFLRYNYLAGEPFMEYGGNIELISGKNIVYNVDILDESKNILLVKGDFSELPKSLEDMMLDRAQDDLETTRFSIIDLKDTKKIYTNFLTPFRKNCVGYLPTADKFVPSYYATDKEIAALNKKTSGYIENIVRGEYIYAHRADHCGKFTYRFHWTDPKNPGPIILEGWQ